MAPSPLNQQKESYFYLKNIYAWLCSLQHASRSGNSQAPMIYGQKAQLPQNLGAS
jgi:hypothetical protein